MKKVNEIEDRVDIAGDAGTEQTETDPEETNAALETELELPTAEEIGQLKAEREEYYDLLLRKQAELENFRKRVQKDKQEVRLAAQTEVLEELLPVLDACEKGLQAISSAGAAQGSSTSYQEGFELLLKQLQAVLGKYDVSEVEGVGATFDPNVHEAIVREVGTEHEENLVIEQYRKGYLIGERLLRPAQVKVSVWPEDSN